MAASLALASPATRSAWHAPAVAFQQSVGPRRAAAKPSYGAAVSRELKTCLLVPLAPQRPHTAPHHCSRRALQARAVGTDATSAGEKVLVVGATGGVGQLVVASLLEKGKSVRALVRDTAKAAAIFAGAPQERLDIVSADLRFPATISAELFQGVGYVVLATGTTAFPSKRWDNNNGPEKTDYVSVKNFLEASPKSLKRIVLVSSIGVTRSNQLPFNILNLFGVLKYKKAAEDLLAASGIPYTILRPGRLTDGPYTSYDLNTLLKATSGLRKAVVVKRGDSLTGETSRLAVAEAAAQALFADAAANDAFEIGSTQGPWPGSDAQTWESIFAQAPQAP